MAVIEHLGLSVTVHVDGSDTAEYDDPEPVPDKEFPHSTVVSKYIESKDDEEYQIHCRVLPQHSWLSKSTAEPRVLTFHTFTDGHWRNGRVHYREKGNGFVLSIQGAVATPAGESYSILSKFKFSPVTTVDAADVETIKTDAAAAASLGTIRVVVWRCLRQGIGSPSQRKRSRERPSRMEHRTIDLHMECKGQTHQTNGVDRLTPPTNVAPETWARTERLYRKPYAIFVFKYRSRDALRKEMIVPRTPSPDPVPEGVEGLSQAELQRLAAERLAQIKTEKKPVIKREFGVMYDLTGDGADGSPRPVKMPRRHKEPETIDLTDD
ncbi:hypothetical protein GE09DRAFT_1076383 [Coniochaeta sp. 2T2.1]|nr:hypothetical protein GE09DRAFT_1076383 [Coniochaeta sp. 2T2.1]